MATPEILVSGGVAAVLAAVAGGGLKAAGVEVPLLSSIKRQILLGIAGIFMLLLGLVYPLLATFVIEPSSGQRQGPTDAAEKPSGRLPSPEPKRGQADFEINSTSQRYEFDRTDILFGFSDRDGSKHRTMYIPFRNSSSSPLEFRIKSGYLFIDGVPAQLRQIDSRWMSLEPAAQMGPEFLIENERDLLRVGSVLDASFEIDIRRAEGAPIERRYEKVRKTVKGLTSAVSTSPEQQLIFRSVILPR